MVRPQQFNNNRQVAVLPNPDQVGGLIIRGVASFARRNKVLAGSYVAGILILLLIGSGTQLTMEQSREYNRIMDTIDVQAEFDASQDYWRARNAYYASKGWFSCDQLCKRNQQRMIRAERVLNDIRKEGYARTSDAKKIAGLFSEVGVGEVKDSFWEYFHAGKEFAKRQSMWDAFFIGIRQISRGRDETWIEYGFKVLVQVLLNFSMGLVFSLIFFIFGLWSIVRAYQPNPIVAVIFFVGAVLAATSFVVSYLLAIYGAAAGGVYAVLKIAETSAQQGRINYDGAGRRQNVGYRPHYN